jgi:hypothetical protein
MAKPEDKKPTVVPAEEFAADVASLLDFARKRGSEARDVRTDSPIQRVSTTKLPTKPDIRDALADELREVLEAEIVPAVETEDADLFEAERRREIQKKALLAVKRKRLSELARSLGLDKRGTSEDLAERIAKLLDYDDRQIAQLIVENVDEPEPERRFADRVFPVAESLDIERTAERLGWVLGRYLRIGVARWVIFEELKEDEEENSLFLKAALFSYAAHVETADDAVSLTATPSTSTIYLKLLADHSAVHIQHSGLNESRGALKALEAVSDIRRLGYLPFSTSGLGGALATFDQNTVVMLDLIYNRVPLAGATFPNLTTAKFRMERGEAQLEGQDDPDRPTLRSVRFEGRHLLDSIAACQLIAQDARALVDISMTAGVSLGSDEEELRFPIRFALEQDHVAVMTGFGLIPQFAKDLHGKLIAEAESTIEDGIANLERLEDLAERIQAFSSSEVAPDRAKMLRPEPYA